MNCWEIETRCTSTVAQEDELKKIEIQPHSVLVFPSMLTPLYFDFPDCDSIWCG
jgi:hypothetical protein